MSLKNSPKNQNKISEIVLKCTSLVTHTEASLQLHCSEDRTNGFICLKEASNLLPKTQKACLKRCWFFFSHAPAVECVLLFDYCCFKISSFVFQVELCANARL